MKPFFEGYIDMGIYTKSLFNLVCFFLEEFNLPL